MDGDVRLGRTNGQRKDELVEVINFEVLEWNGGAVSCAADGRQVGRGDGGGAEQHEESVKDLHGGRKKEGNRKGVWERWC